MSDHPIDILLRAKDQASKTIAGVNRELTKTGKIGKIAGRGVHEAGRNLEKAALGIVGFAAGVGVATVKFAADFESQMNTINTVAQLTGTATSGALGQIGDSIRNLSRTTGTPLEDLTSAYYDLVSAGIKAGDAQNVLTQANTLAIGGLSTTAEAVDLLTTAINSYGGDATKAAGYANMFAEAIAAGKTTASQIAESFAQVGPLAAKTGIGIDEIAAALGVMTAKGTSTGEAMTQIRAAIKLLLKPTSDLAALQKKMGVNFAAMARKKGLAYTYNQIEKAAKKAGIPMAALTGRIEATLFSAQVAGSEFGKYSAELDKVHKASEGAGVAAEQAAKRQQGFNYQLGLIKALAKDAGITIGSKLLPKITPLLQELAAFINAHQDDIAKLGDNLASGLGEAATFVKGVDWASLGAGLQAGGVGAGALIKAFTSAPSWVQGFLITGFVANKFSGGALGGIVGELAKGVIKGVMNTNAAVMNVKAGVVNGLGGPGGGGVPTPGIGDIKVPMVGAVVALGPEDRAKLDQNAQTFLSAVHEQGRIIKQNGGDNRSLIEKFLHPWIDKPSPGLTGGAPGRGGPATGSQMAGWAANRQAWTDTGRKIGDLQHNAVTAIDGSKAAVVQSQDATKNAVTIGSQGIAHDTLQGASTVTTQSIGNASRVVGAIAANRPIVTTDVRVYVTAGHVTRSQTTTSRTGGSSSSNSDDGYSGHGK